MSRAERRAAAGIVLLAAALRFIHLGEWSFWADEIYTLRDAAQFPKPLRLNPLPYAAVSLCLKLFGTSEWSARLAPALIGAASVPLTLALGRRLFSMRVGLIASALVAVSPWHLYWSQNARHYAFAFFFALLAAWAFYAAFEKGGIWKTLAALGALICLSLSHTPASALWLGFAGYAFMRWRLRARFPLPQGAPRFCLFYFGPIALAGLAALTIPALREGVMSGWGRNMWSRGALYVLLTFAHGLTWPTVAALFFSLRGGFSSVPRLFCWCTLVFPFLFFLTASLFQNVAGYYLFFLTPFALLLAAYASRRSRVAVAALLAAALFQTALYYGAENGGRPDWRTALKQTAEQAEPNSAIYFHAPELGDYYAKRRNVRWVKIGPNRVQNPETADWAKRAYVVWDAKWASSVDPTGAFHRWLDANGRRIVRVPGYARASDRTIEAFCLNSAPRESLQFKPK